MSHEPVLDPAGDGNRLFLARLGQDEEELAAAAGAEVAPHRAASPLRTTFAMLKHCMNHVGPTDSLGQGHPSYAEVRFGQKISRHQGSGRYANNASALAIAPSRRSSTRSASRSCANETAPR